MEKVIAPMVAMAMKNETSVQYQSQPKQCDLEHDHQPPE